MATRDDPERAAPKLDAGMPDYSDPSGDDFAALSRDRVPVRSMLEEDLPAIVGIDRKLTGRDRTAYYEHKLVEVMRESGVRVSLIAEVDGRPAGFVMARVDFGEFGHTNLPPSSIPSASIRATPDSVLAGRSYRSFSPIWNPCTSIPSAPSSHGTALPSSISSPIAGSPRVSISSSRAPSPEAPPRHQRRLGRLAPRHHVRTIWRMPKGSATRPMADLSIQENAVDRASAVVAVSAMTETLCHRCGLSPLRGSIR